jgi:hypothetical protein
MIGYDDDDIGLVIKIERDGWVISGHLSVFQKLAEKIYKCHRYDINNPLYGTDIEGTYICVGISISMTREKRKES